MQIPDWLARARRLQAIAQTGLTYAKDPYDMERYSEVRKIAAELMADGCLGDAERIEGLFRCDTGYTTPKVDVRAAVFEQGRVLLVREREDGGWTLPGGWADVVDSPSLAAIREVKEESGYDVAVRKLAAVYDRDLHGHPPIPFRVYKLFFLCDLTGGSQAESHEISAVGFFGEHEMPPLSLTRTTAAEIAHMFEHYRDPDRPTSFD